MCTIFHISCLLISFVLPSGQLNNGLCFSVAVGLWPFIGTTINTRYPTWPTVESNIAYNPANTSNPLSTSVLRFHGVVGSYLVLKNTGGMTVSSFTWAVKVFVRRDYDGPLFNWVSDDVTNGRYGTHIWIVSNKIFLRVVHDGDPTYYQALSGHELITRAWNDVAVSYNAGDGTVGFSVNGEVSAGNVGIIGKHSTYGDVVLGSRHQHSSEGAPDGRTFQGMMACMRLWNVVRDLSTLRINTPLCKIDF